ncbi:transcription initiation factor TFIID subunit 6 isoform X1 [Populus alba]|uniref:Transcription initiation factor TFIID subunit 6-like isoform X1 n=1 Tax=Populus alba x Populus x berolinensis TaxID=444605 RepID=A0AAD6LUJ7_9ROSI|nr:transcription initiation factor TFIID subunit 6-like isoform X1 [Populus alba]KAJ6973360.1 transcription initiation factor TFIID subunit 6-like isoform X1 [Populus alba x Populus x berolinensis]
MSIVAKETIEVIAQSIGISNLSEDVALTLAPDVEFRMRQIMQEAIKCMRHSKRTRLTTDDVDGALNLTNVEPIYGFASGGAVQFKRAIGHRDLFYVDDKDIDFKDVIEAPLPKAPLDTAVVCHWLAIEGVQPAIPENAPLEEHVCSVVIAPPSDGKISEQNDEFPVDIKLPVKHVLSRELQLYFDKITDLTVRRSDSTLFKEALVSLSTDSGLHPLIPYFTYFIADEVARGLNDYSLLFALMRVVWSLLQNPHIHIEPYLHQLMPSVVTCLVARKLGNRFADNHWELRDFTANLVASICKRFGHVYNSLQTRLTKTLLNALLDPKRSLTQHYGAIQGLAALGPNVVRLLLLPNLKPYLQLLEPEMLLEKQKNEMKRHEAWHVYGALLCAAGQSIYDRLKIFPALMSHPAYALLRTNEKVVTKGPENYQGKRKASMEHMEQPPPKKIATDGPVDVVPSHMQVEPTAPVPLGDSKTGLSTSSEHTPNYSEAGSRNKKDKGDSQAIKTSAILSQVWKDDLNSGHLLVSLFELFGESILSFIPSPEMSLFL